MVETVERATVIPSTGLADPLKMSGCNPPGIANGGVTLA